jgi:hypothetical protein
VTLARTRFVAGSRNCRNALPRIRNVSTLRSATTRPALRPAVRALCAGVAREVTCGFGFGFGFDLVSVRRRTEAAGSAVEARALDWLTRGALF